MMRLYSTGSNILIFVRDWPLNIPKKKDAYFETSLLSSSNTLSIW